MDSEARRIDSVVHRAPSPMSEDGPGVTTCCSVPVFELSHYDRLTWVDDLVTCGGRKPLKVYPPGTVVQVEETFPTGTVRMTYPDGTVKEHEVRDAKFTYRMIQ